jgi:hypothetical protein
MVSLCSQPMSPSPVFPLCSHEVWWLFCRLSGMAVMLGRHWQRKDASWQAEAETEWKVLERTCAWSPAERPDWRGGYASPPWFSHPPLRRVPGRLAGGLSRRHQGAWFSGVFIALYRVGVVTITRRNGPEVSACATSELDSLLIFYSSVPRRRCHNHQEKWARHRFKTNCTTALLV